MRALVYNGKLSLVEDYPIPVPPSSEALVRVTLAGICNTDIEITKGYMGFTGVLGHEFVGVVEACADESLIGKRVVGEINCYCGECDYCRQGLVTHCPNRTTLGISGRDGAFADYLVLPRRNLHVVPDALSDEEAVFTEPLAAALEILEQVHVKPTDRTVILGDGKLGLLVAQALSLTGCDLVAVGKHPEKLAILKQRGVETRLKREVSPKNMRECISERNAELRQKTERLLVIGEVLGLKADIVVDCTGNPSGFQMAKQLVRPRGTIVVKSTFHGASQSALTPMVVNEVTIVGSRCGPFAAALRLLERGLVEVRPLTSAVYPLDEGLAAFERAKAKGTLKVLLRM